MSESMRTISKNNYKSAEGSTLDVINTGSLQRIADATELMAQNYLKLQRDLDFYKGLYNRTKERLVSLEKTNRSLKGWVTRLKKQSNPKNK